MDSGCWKLPLEGIRLTYRMWDEQVQHNGPPWLWDWKDGWLGHNLGNPEVRPQTWPKMLPDPHQTASQERHNHTYLKKLCMPAPQKYKPRKFDNFVNLGKTGHIVKDEVIGFVSKFLRIGNYPILQDTRHDLAPIYSAVERAMMKDIRLIKERQLEKGGRKAPVTSQRDWRQGVFSATFLGSLPSSDLWPSLGSGCQEAELGQMQKQVLRLCQSHWTLRPLLFFAWNLSLQTVTAHSSPVLQKAKSLSLLSFFFELEHLLDRKALLNRNKGHQPCRASCLDPLPQIMHCRTSMSKHMAVRFLSC